MGRNRMDWILSRHWTVISPHGTDFREDKVALVIQNRLYNGYCVCVYESILTERTSGLRSWTSKTCRARSDRHPGIPESDYQPCPQQVNDVDLHHSVA